MFSRTVFKTKFYNFLLLFTFYLFDDEIEDQIKEYDVNWRLMGRKKLYLFVVHSRCTHANPILGRFSGNISSLH